MSSRDKTVEEKVSECLTKDQDKSMLERYLDQFYRHLDKELSRLSGLYLRKERDEDVEHLEFRESRDRISILIKTMSELHILEHSSSDYMGSGQIFSNKP
jgi:hypothetical protein